VLCPNTLSSSHKFPTIPFLKDLNPFLFFFFFLFPFYTWVSKHRPHPNPLSRPAIYYLPFSFYTPFFSKLFSLLGPWNPSCARSVGVHMHTPTSGNLVATMVCRRHLAFIPSPSNTQNPKSSPKSKISNLIKPPPNCLVQPIFLSLPRLAIPRHQHPPKSTLT